MDGGGGERSKGRGGRSKQRKHKVCVYVCVCVLWEGGGVGGAESTLLTIGYVRTDFYSCLQQIIYAF